MNRVGRLEGWRVGRLESWKVVPLERAIAGSRKSLGSREDKYV